MPERNEVNFTYFNWKNRADLGVLRMSAIKKWPQCFVRPRTAYMHVTSIFDVSTRKIIYIGFTGITRSSTHLRTLMWILRNAPENLKLTPTNDELCYELRSHKQHYRRCVYKTLKYQQAFQQNAENTGNRSCIQEYSLTHCEKQLKGGAYNTPTTECINS